MSSNYGWDAAGRYAAAAAAGDPQALDALIKATYHDVRQFLAAHAGPADADDLTQETFIRAVRALPRFEGRSSIRTWLLVIARRVAVDHHRHRRARPITADTDDWATAADTAHYRTAGQAPPPVEHTAEVNAMLAHLPTDRREALVLTQILGFSYTEAAEICDVPIGTIRSRVARAREALVAWTTSTDTPRTADTGW